MTITVFEIPLQRKPDFAIFQPIELGQDEERNFLLNLGRKMENPNFQKPASVYS